MERIKINKWSDWIDFTSGGIFAAIFGGDWLPKLHAPMAACYGAHYRNDITDRYIDMLKEFTGFDSVALFSTGSEATEAFWRVCRIHTGKPGIWGGLVDPDDVGKDKAVSDAMHGYTLGALIMSGKMSWPALGVWPELGGNRFGTSYDATGGAIFEPYHAASAQFHKTDPTIDRLKNNRKSFPDIPMCCDEVQGGFGRTGKVFAWEWYDGLKPDFVCVGKAMGGGFPLAALLGPKEIMEDKIVIENAHLHSTHSGHPAMCEVGIQVIEKLQSDSLINQSYSKGMLLDKYLKDCGVRHHSGRGLLAGLEFRDADQADRVVLGCRKMGVLTVSTGRKWIKLGPPFTISEYDIEKGCNIIKSVIAEVLENDAATLRDTGEMPGEGDS